MTTGQLTADVVEHADYMLLDADFTQGERVLRDQVRAFGKEHILPIINDYWERAEFPYEILEPLAELGLAGTVIKGYGCPGLSRLENGIVSRELGRIDGSICTFFGVHSGLSMGSINILGSEEQRQRWLPDMAKFKKTGAFALTEPNHGSDSVSLETSARREGDSWVLNGHKRWIGNGHAGDIIVVYARDEADQQVKAFVVEKQRNGEYPPGYRAEVITGKTGKRAILQGDIVINNLRIPEENRLTNCHSFKDVNRVLAATRGGVAWESTGHAMAGFELAAQYARQRHQFGSPIASYQLVQTKLAHMLADVVENQLLCVRMAELQERGEFSTPMASLTKMTTARNALSICREARDMMGGNGLLLNNHIARHMTDMEVSYTYEGTDSIQALIVGRDITGISAFTHSRK